MKSLLKLVLALVVLMCFTSSIQAQNNSSPKYCSTDVGVLGPYPNDGSVGVGDSCYGTAPDGTKHYGKAVMSKSKKNDDGEEDGGSKPQKGGSPKYCSTDVGVLGPYPNDGSVGVGDSCYGTAPDGTKHYGKAVMSKSGSK